MRKWLLTGLLCAGVGLVAAHHAVYAGEKKSEKTEKTKKAKADTKAGKPDTQQIVVSLPDWAHTVVEPQPLSANVEKGLSYLIAQQQDDGGWGQGGGWRTVSSGGRIQPGTQGYKEQTDVGNTAVATLALIRSGSTPTAGPHQENVRKGLDYIMASIETSDSSSMFVTDTRGTQLQTKIGLYADTFMSVMVLSEMRGRMQNEKANERLDQALNKVIWKIETNMKEDGSFENNRGWASVLSQSVGNKGMSRALLAGADVQESTIRRIQSQATGAYDADGARFKSGEMSGSSAGVALYESSASLAGMSDVVKAAPARRKKAHGILRSNKASKKQKAEAKKTLEEVEQAEEAYHKAASTMSETVKNRQFVSGFGSAGGEEYLSYMNISESLAAKGGKEWSDWNEQVTVSLNKVQNEDGSWAGHHCITGRTFVTSAALLTLMADRAPVPVAMADEEPSKSEDTKK